jgi:hypothetical protein
MIPRPLEYRQYPTPIGKTSIHFRGPKGDYGTYDPSSVQGRNPDLSGAPDAHPPHPG